MLAVVQPFNVSTPPDVARRTQPARPSSRSAATVLAPPHGPPALQRHQTAPPALPAPAPAPSRIPTPPPPPLQPTEPFDINAYPPADLLKLLALLLTHIATTNDALPAPPAPPPTEPSVAAAPVWASLTTASRGAVSTPAATLTFHARNVPTISLEAYLLRILKYCPTSNHVFLSLLVYFDRMSKLGEDAAGRAFVIDSYNIHRLVIAGVTVASKFFSDVFYTNSRYAKVGGLPLAELNQLELHFLLLNDFRLVIARNEMQHYAEQLILFARSSVALAGVVYLPPIVPAIPPSLLLAPAHATVPGVNGGEQAPSGTSSSGSSTATLASQSQHPTRSSSPVPPPTTTPPARARSGAFAPSTMGFTSASASAPMLGFAHPLPAQRGHVHVQAPHAPARPLAALGGLPPALPPAASSSGSAVQPSYGVYQQYPYPSHQSQHAHHQHPHAHHQSAPHLQHQHQHQQHPYTTPRAPLPSASQTDDVDTEVDVDVDDADADADCEDADASTDAGTETSTDDEPTIRAGRTVAGSVWGDDEHGDVSGDRSRNGDEDVGMRSP